MDVPITDWIMALGTVATAIVAMFVAFLPSLRRWYNRPKFEIEFENREPFCRHASIPKDLLGDVTVTHVLIPAYWVRVKVRNKGRSIARACEGKLVRITDAKTQEDRTDFDPVVLHWVGSTLNPIDINKKEFEYLDVVFTRSDDPNRIYVNAEEMQPRGINLAPEKRDYILHITLYGENVKPLEKSFHLKCGKKYDEIELSEHKDT